MSRQNHRFVYILAVAAITSVGAAVSAQGPVCQDPHNLTNNCGFDVDASGWTPDFGTISWEPTDGNDAQGSMEVLSEQTMPEETIWFGQCVVGVPANITYGYGGFVKVVVGTPYFLQVEVTNFDSTNCSGNGTSSTFQQISTFSSQWDQMNWTFSTDAGTQSVLIYVEAFSLTGILTLRFDDLFLGENLVPVELQSLTVE